MRLKFPAGLHYPITVKELLKRPDDDIKRADALFSYTYISKRMKYDRDGVEEEVQHTMISQFESSVDGKLLQWVLKKGDVIQAGGGDIVDVDEPCLHPIQYGGICGVCGKDMTQSSYVTTSVDTNRASIQMIHDNVALTVSADLARQAEDSAQRRLLAARKLSLVVDLDQTIIHATVDPTVAEWKQDESNPNYNSLQDVREFQLLDEGPGGRGTWYYIKFRPGLQEFLENLAQIYEMHIYTMGTRAYAQHIAQLVDPNRKIFADRILSRDESGSLTAKDLQRIFPVDTSMVAVIDDRADVWSWSANLVKVTPFSYFIGIGDINSSFLPKKPKLRIPAKSNAKPAVKEPCVVETTTTEAEPTTSEDKSETPQATEEAQKSAVDQLVAMSGGDDPKTIEEQTAKQDEALAAQLQERPLAQMQKQLDAEDDSDSDSDVKPKHHLLSDDDNELVHLEAALRKVHTEFYSQYDQSFPEAQAPRVAQLKGSPVKSKLSTSATSGVVPDIKVVMPAIKKDVLKNVRLVFSGVIPLDADPRSSEIVVWATSFGATIEDRVSGRSTTHVVAARNRTAKVRQAVARGKGRIKVVTLNWLMDSIVQWQHLDETPYLMQTEAADIGKPFAGEDEMLSESEEARSNMDTDTDANTTDTESYSLRKPRITIKPPRRLSQDDDDLVDQQRSPAPMSPEDYASMMAEIDELASDSDDDDNVSVASSILNLTNGNGKHIREETDDESERERSMKKIRPDESVSGRPSPSINGDDDEDLMAEFEQAMAED